MDIRQLQYLTTVARYQSITKAANVLYISQSAMSHYIQKVEAELGVPLFDRSTTPLTLTYAGKRYMESADKILLENERLMKEFRDITQHMTGVLRIGTSHERASYMLPRLLPEFSALYPGIEVEVMTRSGQKLYEALKEGRIDLMLLPPRENVSSQGIEAEDIYTEELILSAKKGLIRPDMLEKSNPRAINPQKLNHMPFFLLYQEHAIRNFCDAYFKKNRIRPQIKMESASNITCHRLSATGLGFAIIPYLTTQITHCEQEVELFSLSKEPQTWNVQVLYRKDAYLGRPEKDFIEIAKRSFRRETLSVHEEDA